MVVEIQLSLLSKYRAAKKCWLTKLEIFEIFFSLSQVNTHAESTYHGSLCFGL